MVQQNSYLTVIVVRLTTTHFHDESSSAYPMMTHDQLTIPILHVLRIMFMYVHVQLPCMCTHLCVYTYTRIDQPTSSMCAQEAYAYGTRS